MLTERAARLLNMKDYGLAPGSPTGIVVTDVGTPRAGEFAYIHPPLAVWKRSRRSVTRQAPELLRPEPSTSPL